MSRDQTINRLTKTYSVNIKLTITVYDNPPRQQELHVTEIPVFSRDVKAGKDTAETTNATICTKMYTLKGNETAKETT